MAQYLADERLTVLGRPVLITTTQTAGGFVVRFFDGWLNSSEPFVSYFASGIAFKGERLTQIARNLVATAKNDLVQRIVALPSH